jgi:putative zinc finger protein/TonB-like protein
MTCRGVRQRLSAYLDGELRPAEAGRVGLHLEACVECATRWRGLRSALGALSALPRLEGSDGISARVLDRLELERRGPGIALLVRRWGTARPLIIPSLLPAALILIVVLAGALALDRVNDPGPLPEVAARGGGSETWSMSAPSGSEGNPLFASAGVTAPRARGTALPDHVLTEMAEGTLFVETVVARDGTVSTVTLLNGDSDQARPLLEALRRERFEPGRLKGRPVAVSVYRLISRMDVRASIT